MIGALDKGMAMSEKCIEEILVTQEGEQHPAKSLYANLERSNVKTMSTMKKRVKISIKMRALIVK